MTATALARFDLTMLPEEMEHITLTTRDFQAFASALNTAFSPNAALQQAIDAAKQIQHVRS